MRKLYEKEIVDILYHSTDWCIFCMCVWHGRPE